MHPSKNISKEPCATPDPYTIGLKATSFRCSLLATLSTPLGRAFKSRCDRVATADLAESIRLTQSLFPTITVLCNLISCVTSRKRIAARKKWRIKGQQHTVMMLSNQVQSKSTFVWAHHFPYNYEEMLAEGQARLTSKAKSDWLRQLTGSMGCGLASLVPEEFLDPLAKTKSWGSIVFNSKTRRGE